MNTDYNYFKYSLPPQPASFYAEQALEILIELKTKFPHQYKHSFRCPSEVLTLSGVRAFDTYYDLGSNTTDKDWREIKDLLAKYNVRLLDLSLRILDEDNPENLYSIIHTKAINEIPKNYKNVPQWRAWNEASASNDTDFLLWWLLWRSDIQAYAQYKSKDELRDILQTNLGVDQDITFGMLLGYPGEAILSIIKDNHHKSQMREANISNAWKYDGAIPVYDYHKSLAGDPNIVAHQKLWSDILDNVYSVIS